MSCQGFKVPKCSLLYTKIHVERYLKDYLPWWPSCLDRGALINVDAPGGSRPQLVRGPTGHK